MKIVKKSIVVAIIIMITACSSTLSKQDLTGIKTIGIINNFPEHFGFVNSGTTIFNDDNEIVNGLSFKPFISSEMISRLMSKGFVVKDITRLPEEKLKVDLVLEIDPKNAGVADVNGYGFYDKSMFGKSLARWSFVHISLTPFIHGEAKYGVGNGVNQTTLPVEEMPSSWNSLTPKMQADFKAILMKDIEIAVDEALINTGLIK